MTIFIYLIIFALSIIQSIAGVGILVLGTPMMLILNYSILETMFFLLPISIISSIFNLILIKNTYNVKKKIDWNLIKYFFTFCFPSVCLGLIIIKNFNEHINFNILVSIIIFISVITKIKYEKFIINLKKNSKKFITFFIGLIHGLTNSGGTLLSLFFISKDKNKINYSRFEIHLFYFLLAITQLIFLYFLVDYNLDNKINLYTIFFLIFSSTIIGNIIANKFKFLISKIVYILAGISSFILILRSF